MTARLRRSVVAALGVVVAACGGGGPGQQGASSPSPTMQQTPPGQTPAPPTPAPSPTATPVPVGWQTVEVVPGGTVWSITEDAASGRLWAGASDAAGRGGVHRSDDGGRTWVHDSPSDGPATTVRVDPDGSGDLFAYFDGDDGGLFAREAANGAWRRLSEGAASLYNGPSALAVAPGARFFVVSDGNVFVARTDDDPFHVAFEYVLISAPEGICHDVRDVAIVPSDPLTIYANSNGGGLIVSRDRGQTWPIVPEVCLFQAHGRRRAIALDPTDPSTVYAGARGAVRKTDDGGSSYRTIPIVTATDESPVTGIAVDPAAPRTLYAAKSIEDDGLGTASVFASDDAGESWRAIGDLTYVYDLLVGGDGTLYAATTGGVAIRVGP